MSKEEEFPKLSREETSRKPSQFSPNRVDSVFFTLGQSISEALHDLRRTSAEVSLDEIFNIICTLIPFSSVNSQIVKECEFRANMAISRPLSKSATQFILQYAQHLGAGRISLPKTNLAQAICRQLLELGSSQDQVISQIEKRLLQRKTYGCDVLSGDPGAIVKFRLDRTVPMSSEIKWKYPESHIEVEFFVDGILIRSVAIRKEPSQILREEIAAGGLLVLDEDFLLQKFDKYGDETGRTIVPNFLDSPTRNGFRYTRGRCLCASADGTIIYVSDYTKLYKYNQELVLTCIYDFDHFKESRPWNDKSQRLGKDKGEKDLVAGDQAFDKELATLELSRVPDQINDLRQAYREMSFRIHPDHNPSISDATEKMVTLNLAYARLKDFFSENHGTKSALYDRDPFLANTIYSADYDSVQSVCITQEGCLVATYKGGIYSVMNGHLNIIEQALFRIRKLYSKFGHRAYLSTYSVLIVPRTGRSWEVSNSFLLVEFAETLVGFADGNLVRLYCISGNKLFEASVPNAVKKITFNDKFCFVQTINDMFKLSIETLRLGHQISAPAELSIVSNELPQTKHLVNEPKWSELHHTVFNAVTDQIYPGQNSFRDLVKREGVDVQDQFGRTPLHLLCTYFSIQTKLDVSMYLLNILVDIGADVNAQVDSWAANQDRYPDYRTCLHIVIERIDSTTESSVLPFINLLIARGINTNLQDASGIPPLRIAVNRNLLATAKVLLDAGADPCAVDKRGISLLKKAISRNLHDMACLLQLYLPR